MKTLNASPRLVWFKQSEAGSPDLQEESFEGTLTEAIAAMESRSTQAGFLLGQVLESSGMVHATIAPGGAKHVNSEAQAH